MSEATAWRFEPLDPNTFPVGEGPFRARGVAYIGALKYVDAKLPGGRGALVAALQRDAATAQFLEQIFIAGSDYDVSPLVCLYAAAAQIEKLPVAQLVRELSRKTSEYSARTLWKSMLNAASPEAMAERLPATFDRFYAPSRAETVSIERGRFVCELRSVPACMSGLHVWSTHGFVAAALEVAGAQDVKMTFARSGADGAPRGVPTERVRFVATWSPGAKPASGS